MNKFFRFVFIIVIIFCCDNVFAYDNGLFTDNNGNLFYYNDNVMQHGVQNVDDNLYFFGINSGIAQKGWINYGGKIYYADPNTGVLSVGLTIIDNKLYYFDKNTGLRLNNVQNVDGNLYFFGITTGVAQKGWINYGGKKYYADSSTGILISGGVNMVDGNYYFFGIKTGAVQTGLINYNNDYYYADPVSLKLKNNVQIVDGHAYFFGITTFKAQCNVINYKGNYYYGDPVTKQLANGVTRIDNNNYFFGMTSYKRLYGWINYKGNIYYANSNGELQKGQQYIDDNYYEFDDNYLLKTGWVNINGNTYYFYSDGTKATGVKKITGSRYLFNSNGELIQSNVQLWIDVSKWQGNIDWNLLWSSGEIDGVIIRMGYIGYEDAYYYKNLSEVKRLGIPYTLYYYSYAENADEALGEAQHIVSLFNKYSASPSMNIYYDVEKYYLNNKQMYKSIIETAVGHLNSFGIGMRVYTGKNFALNQFDDDTRNYVDWIAHYTGDPILVGYDNNGKEIYSYSSLPNRKTDYSYNYRMWQYSDYGFLAGINGPVDLNVLFK